MKIIAFGASSARESINKKLATFVAKQFDISAEILDLNHYAMPLYSVDYETENGIPELAKQFVEKLNSATLIIISLAEHNGAYTTAFKNIFDWATRVKMACFENKKVFLLATSPGARGGISVLEIAKNRFPYHGAEIVGSFSLPNFSENFSEESGILNENLKKEIQNEIEKIKNILK